MLDAPIVFSAQRTKVHVNCDYPTFWVDSLGPEVQPNGSFLTGFQGQFVIVLPSQLKVIVRLGNAAVEGLSIAREMATDVPAALKAQPSAAPAK